MQRTSIAILQATRERLQNYGFLGETYDGVINRLLNEATNQNKNNTGSTHHE